MRIIKFGEKYDRPIVVCLGYFGCMHLGHLELLKAAKVRAEQFGADVALFTFENNHLRVLGKDTKVLYTFSERTGIYERLGVDVTLAALFDNGFKNQTGNSFLSRVAEYDVKAVVCGFDHRCGCDGLSSSGISDFFRDVCPVDVIGQISADGEKVSTTLIRRLIGENDLERANKLLSENFFVEGKVCEGRKVGRTLGFPTANLETDGDKFLPLGVYSAITDVGAEKYLSIVNIGSTPTFSISRLAFEVHLLGFDGDLYGRTLKVSLKKFLRPICKFGDAKILREQLQKDKENALRD